jgi:hypothetical protein
MTDPHLKQSRLTVYRARLTTCPGLPGAPRLALLARIAPLPPSSRNARKRSL